LCEEEKKQKQIIIRRRKERVRCREREKREKKKRFFLYHIRQRLLEVRLLSDLDAILVYMLLLMTKATYFLFCKHHLFHHRRQKLVLTGVDC
jgi:hypothetical protein